MKPNSYEDITIHVGTNDCTTRYPVDKICANLKEMATHAKRVSKTGHVSFSSITPRVDNLSAAAKGAEVNEGMKRVAEESGCQYICNQDNFLCRNGDVNMELVAVDGLHLSKLGTERLIENLKLNDTACCRIGRSQRPGLDPQQKYSRPWRGTEPAAPGGHHRTGQWASHQASSNDLPQPSTRHRNLALGPLMERARCIMEETPAAIPGQMTFPIKTFRVMAFATSVANRTTFATCADMGCR